MNVFELFAKIVLDTNDYEDGLKKAGNKMSAFGNALKSGITTAAKVGGAAIGAVSTGIVALTTSSVKQFAEYEQLAGGAQKIFDQMDFSRIADDANNAYKELGLSANQYLAVINDVGATFAATMGDEAGYSAAKTGLKAISDYASGTGKNVDELSQKFTLITRSTSSYQSIADQFSGILPATSAGFLEQAQAAGLLSSSYTQLTQVPIAEYQAAVSKMLQKGVSDLGLANNTMDEAFSTLSGSLAMAKSAWSNLVTGLTDDSANLDELIGNFIESIGSVAENLVPKISIALNGAAKLIGDIIPVVVREIPALLEENLPVLVEAAVNIVQSIIDGISENKDSLIATITDVVTTLITSIADMLPQIIQLGLEIIASLAIGISESLPELVPTIVEVLLNIVQTIVDNIPLLIDAALQLMIGLADGIIAAIPVIIEALPNIITGIVDGLLDATPQIIQAGIQLLISLVDALPEIIAGIIDAIPKIIDGIITAVMDNLPAIIEAGIQLFISLVEDLPTITLEIVKAVPKIISAIIDAFVSSFPKIVQIGADLIKGLWDGIVSMADWIWDNISGFFSGIVDGIKGLLGINSPSKVLASVGKNMALGLGQGWEKEFTHIKKDINNDMDFGTATIDFASSGLWQSNRMLNNSLMQTYVPNESGDIVINLTSEIDGSILARKMVKYNRNAEFLQGNPA